MKVLIADDHPRMRDAIQGMLQAPSVEMFAVGDGCAAVQAYLRHAPDWVLLDIEMPGMDGMAVTREILRVQPGARIIMVTAHDTPALRAAARLAGARAFVPKSDLQTLRELIQPSKKHLP